MERWGDAPMHTLAAAMLLNVSEVAVFMFCRCFYRLWRRGSPLQYLLHR